MTSPLDSSEPPSDNGQRDLSISMAQANLYGLVLLIPGGVLLGIPYWAIWGRTAFGQAWSGLADNLLIALGVLAAGVIIHELIHGVSWRIFGKKPPSAIRYGFQLKTLTPYAHCTEPMDSRAYRLGAAMPGLLLGVLPWLAALRPQATVPLFIFGLIFTLAALGDAMILWILRGVAPEAQVIDHPSRAGCYVIDPKAA